MRRRAGDRGFVLVNALIVIAAVSTLAIGVLRDSEAGIERTGALRAGDRAARALDGAALLVRLRMDDDDAEVDTLADGWLFEAETWPVEGAILALDTRDLQGLFNLNWLLRQDLPGIDAAFEALALAAGVPGDASAAILSRYAALRGPSGPASPPAGSDFAPDEIALAAELLALDGVEPAALEALAPVVAFLPAESALNLNTAPKEVVLALTGASETAWSGFAAVRDRPFDAGAEALAALEAALDGEAPIVAALAGVATSWVELRARAAVEGERWGATFVFRRGGSPPAARLVLRVPTDV